MSGGPFSHVLVSVSHDVVCKDSRYVQSPSIDHSHWVEILSAARGARRDTGGWTKTREIDRENQLVLFIDDCLLMSGLNT